MREGVRLWGGLWLLLVGLSLLDVARGQLAPVVVVTESPKPQDAASIKMAESLTSAEEAQKEDSVREVLAETEEFIQGNDGVKSEKELKTMSDLLEWSVNAAIAANETGDSVIGMGNTEARELEDLDSILRAPEIEITELDVMREALAVLVEEEEKMEQDMDMNRMVDALMTVEELCHSMENAQDLILLENAVVLVKLLNASNSEVRSGAAWALATCMQNNLTVQRSLLQLGILDKLMSLALEDKNDGVRGKILFALICLAEYEDGRQLLEADDRVVLVLEGSLKKRGSTRVVRRALNMGEVLVQKAGSIWRPKLITVGRAAEKVMRESSDEDVRESAARFVKALYSSDP